MSPRGVPFLYNRSAAQRPAGPFRHPPQPRNRQGYYSSAGLAAHPAGRTLHPVQLPLL